MGLLLSSMPYFRLKHYQKEARNKHFRQFRESFSRKFSREQCNTDIINRLLLTSDPYLSCNSKNKSKKSEPFCKTTLEILLPGKVTQEVESDEEVWDSSD
ncbi:unnamed protein product [Brassicogethes aeneus]|uniref:Uncharacterized protein n=1 Tax=Brassicogethes aeneus TaxID=1431903 RepID=A0A9P0FC99_BRAAE|nr:unnamed protein product [Brassicogethes aeneus]